jgi:sulfopyruvate decarboxylase subunit alpha
MASAEAAQRFIGGLKEAGVDFVVAVPDINLLELMKALAADKDIEYTPVGREEEGIGICAGAYLGGKVPAMIMMDAGLLACSNALTVLAGQAGIPMLLLVGYSGGLGERYFMHTPLGRVLEPLLGALGIVYTVAERADDVADKILRANTLAYSSKRPVAVVLDGECLRQ